MGLCDIPREEGRLEGAETSPFRAPYLGSLDLFIFHLFCRCLPYGCEFEASSKRTLVLTRPGLRHGAHIS